MSLDMSSSSVSRCLDSLSEGVVVAVVFWCRRGEKISIGLAVGELERPLVGHVLGVLVGWIGGELVHTVSEKTVRTLQMQVRAMR